MITIRCPQCQTPRNVSDAMKGTNITCAKCSATVLVTASSPSRPVPVPPPAPPKTSTPKPVAPPPGVAPRHVPPPYAPAPYDPYAPDEERRRKRASNRRARFRLGLLAFMSIVVTIAGVWAWTAKRNRDRDRSVAATATPSSGADDDSHAPSGAAGGTEGRPALDGVAFDENDGLRTRQWVGKIRADWERGVGSNPGNPAVAKSADDSLLAEMKKPIGHRVMWKARIMGLNKDDTVFLDPIGETNAPLRERLIAKQEGIDYRWRSTWGICMFLGQNYTPTKLEAEFGGRPFVRMLPIPVREKSKLLSARLGDECRVSAVIVVWSDAQVTIGGTGGMPHEYGPINGDIIVTLKDAIVSIP